MALRKQTDNVNADADQNQAIDQTIDQAPEVAKEVVQEVAKTDPASAAATKEVTQKKSAAAPAVANKVSFFKTNEIIEDMIANAMPRDYTTIVATGGTFKISGDKSDLGSIIEFRVMGTRKKYSCSTGDSGEEAKQFFAAAYDDEPAHDGRSIEEWVQDAKDNGYDKAKKAEYLDLFVEIADHSSTKVVDLCGEPIAVLQLSFMSTKRWKQFADGLKLKCSWGQEVPWGEGTPLIRAVATPANSKGRDYTEYAFSLAPDQK